MTEFTLWFGRCFQTEEEKWAPKPLDLSAFKRERKQCWQTGEDKVTVPWLLADCLMQFHYPCWHQLQLPHLKAHDQRIRSHVWYPCRALWRICHQAWCNSCLETWPQCLQCAPTYQLGLAEFTWQSRWLSAGLCTDCAWWWCNGLKW